jgi:autotransporter-associated beta strand protein
MKRIIPFVRSFCAFAALFLMLSSGAASAQVIASDFFSYTPGINNLQGNNGGAGWAAAWLAPGSSSDSASVQAAASPLDFVPLGGADINGGATSVNCYGTASASAAARQLATPLTSTFYVRFLVQYNNTNVPPLNNFNGSDTFALHFSDTASDTSTLNFGLRFSEVSTFMTRNGTGTPVTGAFITNSFQAGATHLMVAQVVNSGGVFNHINGWLDPSYGSSNAPTITLSAGTLSAINYLFFRVAANESDDRYLIDNLLVGQTWNDVVPPGAPPVVLISVETAANGSGTVVPAQNITAGNVLTLYAIARQTNGLFLSNTPAIWSEQNVTGGVVSGDLVPSGNGMSAAFTGHLAGSANVMASVGADAAIPSGALNVVTGSASQIRVETKPDGNGAIVPAQSIASGETLTVYSIVRDAGGNFLSNAPAAWSMSTTGGVTNTDLMPSIDELSATFTGNLTGTAIIHASANGLASVDSGLLTVVLFGGGIIAMDDFNYAPGINNLQGDNGGTGWTGPWLAPLVSPDSADVVNTTASPLDFVPVGGADINGGTRAVSSYGTTGGGVAERSLAVPLTNTFYIRYLAQYNDTNVPPQSNLDDGDTFSLYLSDTSSDIQTLNFGMRYNSTVGADTFMVRNGTSPTLAGVFITNQFLPGVTHLMVAEVINSNGVFSQINGWLDPAYGSSNSPSVTLSAGTLTSVNDLIFRVAQTATETDDRYLFDSLVVGKTWDDVVPPSGPRVPEISVETAPDGTGTVVPARTLAAGNSFTLYAIARDGNGAYLSNTPASWSVENVTGGIANSDVVVANGGKSVVFTSHLVGTANIIATGNASQYVPSGTITVLSGSPAFVQVETAPNGSGTIVPAQTIPSSFLLTAYASIRDVGGNFLSNSSAAWSLSNTTSGVMQSNLVPSVDNLSATFTAGYSGTAIIHASVQGVVSVDSGLITVVRNMTWVGGGGNNWDLVTSDWTPDFSTMTPFFNGDAVTFDAGGSQSSPVNIVAHVAPAGIDVVAGTYTLAGSGTISGSGGLTNSSGNMLTLLTTNTYTGPTIVTYGELQLGNGETNGSLGLGDVTIGTGAISPIFNRTDTAASPYVVSNTISGPADFTMNFVSGVTTLTGTSANVHAMAHVFSNATLILSKTGAGSDIGTSTALGGTPLIVEAGGTVILGVASTGGDHITSAGKYVYVDGVLDANGISEAYGVQQGSGVLDNTSSDNAVLTINQGATTPGVGNNGEIFTFSGTIQNSGTGTLGITKDGLNTLILASANTYRGDTQIIDGGVLQLGDPNSIQNSTLNLATGNSGTLSFGSLTSANFGGLKGSENLDLDNSAAAPVALAIGANGQANIYSGNLTGGGSLTKTGTGTQTLSGVNSFLGPIMVSRGTLLVTGTLNDGSVTVGPGGTLGGNGVIGGVTTVEAGGTLALGSAIATLTVTNAASLQGSTILKVNRTNSPSADKLSATSITLGGTLLVTNVGPAALKSGDSFTLFSGSLSGTVALSPLPPLLPGLSWNTNSLNSAGVISVTGTASPLPTGFVRLSNGNFEITGGGGIQGATFYLLASTNLALPFSQWTRIVTNAFGVGGSFSNSIPVALSNGEQFFVLEAQ